MTWATAQVLPTATEPLPVAEARILEIGRKIGRQFRPQEVILFGSYGRGDQTADSDIDLPVVFRNGVDKAAEAIRIRRAIGRINTGVDIVVSSAQEMAEWQDVPGTVFYYARREGRPIHGHEPGSRAWNCIKAVLAVRQVEFRKIHDITTLLDLVRDAGVEVPSAEQLDALTPFAAEFRYRALPLGTSPVERDKMPTLVQAVCEWARARILPEGSD